MEKCEGKIGCHACLNFMQILEHRLNKFLEASDNEATPNMVYEAKATLEVIQAFKKGG